MSLTWIAVVATTQSAIALPAIDQSHVITQSVGGLNTEADYTPAQTFTVGAAGKLSMIDVQISRDAGALDDLALEIWPTTAGVPSGTTPLFTTPIAASAVPVASPSAALPYTPVNVAAANLNVHPGEVYAIAVRGPFGDDEPNAFWNWGFPGYSGGNPFDSFSGQPWDEVSSTFDFGFRTWVDPNPSVTQTLTFIPEFDAAAEFVNGLGYVISEGDWSIPVRRVSFSGIDERGIMEFDLSAIPKNATIQSASLSFDMDQRTEGPGEYPIVELYGYAGDGAAQSADATSISNLLGTSPQIDTFERLEVELDPSRIGDLKFDSNFLGLVAYQRISPHSVHIVASELANISPTVYIAPTLSISFSVPPPPARRLGDYNGNGIEDAADYTVWRDSLGQSGDDLPADGDGNGTVEPNDYQVWKNAFANRPPPGVRNGEFANGLDQWETIVDPNTDVSNGFPRTESFDVDGDGTADSAVRIRLARINASLSEGGRAGLDQEILLLQDGDYQLSADFAAASFQDFGNTAPGRFELYFDDTLVDLVDLNGTTINAFEVMRGTLEAALDDVEAGYHKLGLRVHRPGVNSREIYQYFDNIALSLVSPLDSAAVPEPSTALAGLLAVGLFAACDRRRPIG